MVFSGLRYKVDPTTGLLSLIQHLYDDETYCSPVIKAKHETEEGAITRKLQPGKSLAYIEFKQRNPTTQHIIMTLPGGKVFVEFIVHVNEGYNPKVTKLKLHAL